MLSICLSKGKVSTPQSAIDALTRLDGCDTLNNRDPLSGR